VKDVSMSNVFEANMRRVNKDSLAGSDGSFLDRRGSNPSMASFGGSSLRDKLSANLRGRMEKFRRLSTIKKNDSEHHKNQLDSLSGNVIEEVKDDETALDNLADAMPDDLDSEAFDTHYDVINLAEESNPYHKDVVKALTFFKSNSQGGEQDFDPAKAAKSK